MQWGIYMKKINSHFSHSLLSPELEYIESMQSYNQNLLLKVHTQRSTRSQDRRGNLSMIKGWNKIPAKGDTLPSSVCGSAAPVHHLEDTYMLWATSLGAGPGRPCTHTSIPRLLCDQRQASDRQAARSRMPTETVNLHSLLSSWYTILCSWASQCRMHSLRRASAEGPICELHSDLILRTVVLRFFPTVSVSSLAIPNLFSLGILYISSHVSVFLKILFKISSFQSWVSPRDGWGTRSSNV